MLLVSLSCVYSCINMPFTFYEWISILVYIHIQVSHFLSPFDKQRKCPHILNLTLWEKKTQWWITWHSFQITWCLLNMGHFWSSQNFWFPYHSTKNTKSTRLQLVKINVMWEIVWRSTMVSSWFSTWRSLDITKGDTLFETCPSILTRFRIDYLNLFTLTF